MEAAMVVEARLDIFELEISCFLVKCHLKREKNYLNKLNILQMFILVSCF